MRTTVKMEGATSVIKALNGSRSKLRKEWKRRAFAIAARGVTIARKGFDTEVRSGQRRRSWGHRVADTSDGMVVDVGPIRPSVGGKVPIHARVLEGFDAQGRKVGKFVIKAKTPDGYLTFPIRKGPGLSRRSIVGWARVKQVTLTPDPSFPRVDKFMQPALEKSASRVFRQVLGG